MGEETEQGGAEGAAVLVELVLKVMLGSYDGLQ